MRVKCKSGLTGWRMRLRAVYGGCLEDWLAYACTYGLAKRLGYATAQDAWEANPLVEGSTDPRDYRVADGRCEWTDRGCKIVPEIGKSRYFGRAHYDPHKGGVMYRTRYWRVCFPDRTWILCGTKEDSRAYIDEPRNDLPLRAG